MEDSGAAAHTASSGRQSPSHQHEFPAGFRFLPTAVEILKYYLPNVASGLALPYDGGFEEMDIYRHDPDQLPIDISDGHSRWAFFIVFTAMPDEDDHGNVRSTPHGLWKLQRPDRPVKDDDGRVIGYKRSFAFYYKKAHCRFARTGWRMNEYRLSRKFYRSKDDSKISRCVACKIYILMEDRAKTYRNHK
ncbi:hypothetical protein OPV22_001734 [Ensete ventricosum]|uniref:NAC domain-containing protein n=1 Tax=Ensete ventricosum TaxID=4639 RepID=A0AAV8RW45_ENSVE|nr:hypothetical protein OPV22_001734 [Ensete ventricosum]RWW29492.1 hypothetical protein GW17_00005974 [Ensete ventricosum]